MSIIFFSFLIVSSAVMLAVLITGILFEAAEIFIHRTCEKGVTVRIRENTYR